MELLTPAQMVLLQVSEALSLAPLLQPYLLPCCPEAPSTPTSHPRAFAQALPAVWNPCAHTCSQIRGFFSLWELIPNISSSEGPNAPPKKKGFVFFAACITECVIMIAYLLSLPLECELQEGRAFVLFPMPVLPSTGRQGMQ